MKYFYCLALILLGISGSVYAQDTLYFDKDWHITTKDNHHYYRPMPLKEHQGLLLLQDFYKNGNLQKQAYVMQDNLEQYIGDASWYTASGQPASVYYNNFTIAENPQDSYQGTFRNGQPFDGYFKLTNLIDNIPLIDYYENGILKYQYSFELLDQMDNYEHYTYTFKSIFKDGKVWDGSIYKKVGKEILLRIGYTNGDPVNFDVNLFAMHYFNRLTFHLNNNKLSIKELNTPLEIKAVANADHVNLSLYDNEVLKQSSQQTAKLAKEGSPNSITFYYRGGDQLNKFIVHADDLEIVNSDNHLLYRVYSQMLHHSKQDLNSIFTWLLERFTSEDIQSILAHQPNMLFPFDEQELITMIQFDKNGKVANGIQLSMQKDNEILAEAFVDGKSKGKEIFKLSEDFYKRDTRFARWSAQMLGY